MSFYRVNKFILMTFALGKFLIQRTLMIVASCNHLLNNLLMNPVQCLQFPFPSLCFGMMGISCLSLCKDIPHGMEFIMLTKQVITAQYIRRDVPYSHITIFDNGTCTPGSSSFNISIGCLCFKGLDGEGHLLFVVD